MPSLLTQNEISYSTGLLNDLFDTVARPIVVFKEPISNIIENTDVLFGYENSSTNSTQVTYTPVSGVFDAQILYPRASRNQNNTFFDNKIMVDPNSTYIKVRRDARDFIKNGKTELVQFDDSSFNIEGSEQVQYFLGLQFYYFELKGTH